MGKWTLGITVLVLGVILGGRVIAGDMKQASSEKSSGLAAAGQEYEVVDVACYVQKNASGPDHKACAVKCISGGGELALLKVKGKKLYIPVDSSFHSLRAQFVPKAGEIVKVDGKAISKGGLNYLVVSDSTDTK